VTTQLQLINIIIIIIIILSCDAMHAEQLAAHLISKPQISQSINNRDHHGKERPKTRATNAICCQNTRTVVIQRGRTTSLLNAVCLLSVNV